RNMFGIHDFALFLAAGILLNLTPGPDTAYILGRSIAQGREAGIASALGICVGSIFHTCAAALGLSAILATSAVAFGAVKLPGSRRLSAKDCAGTRQSGNGSIAPRVRFLFSWDCGSRQQSDNVDLVGQYSAQALINRCARRPRHFRISFEINRSKITNHENN